MTGDARKGLLGSRAKLLPLALAGAFACHGSWAQDALQLDGGTLPSLAEQTARLEVNTSNFARPDRFDGAVSGQRVDMMLLPPRSSAIGLAVGMSGFSTPSTPMGAGLVPQVAPAIDVGVHWRHTLDSNYRVDVTAWRRMPNPQADAWSLAQMQQPTYGARVELNLSPRGPQSAKKEFASDKGFIGMQLENGGRISIRRKFGGPMIYYRNTF